MATHPSTYWRRLMRATRLTATVVIAAAATVLTAPVGNAIPESQIQSECAAANGEYRQVVQQGGDGVTRSYSKCCYVDIYGKKHCDNYVDGNYTNTTVNLEEPPATSAPPPPPGGVVGPAEQAQEVERQPAPPAAPGQPAMVDGGMTVYMPSPPGPAAPPPSGTTLAP